MNIFDNLNNVKIILDVPYDKKTTAKEYKARWCPDNKIWYIVHNNNECNESRKCFGNIKIFSTKALKFSDIDKQDFSILILLVFFLMLTGVYSSSILDYISVNTTLIINRSIYIIEETTRLFN